MRPTALVDSDGILSDFIGAALLALRAESGVSVPREAIKTWDVFDSIPAELQRYKDRVYNLLKAKLGCFSIRPYDGAKQGMKKLEEIADVVVVTSPFSGSDTWMSERERWLHMHFGIPGSRVIHAQAKHHIKGDYFVDDKTSHVLDWAKAHPTGRALLWDMPYNQNDELPANLKGVQRVASWDELCADVAGGIRLGL